MTVPLAEFEPLVPFFRRLQRRDDLAAAEQQAMLNSVSDHRDIEARSDIVREGDRPRHCTLLVTGFAARYRVVASGERQITAIHVPGDFVDLHSFPLKEMDHSVLAMSNTTVARFPHEALEALTEQYPHLTRLLWLSTLLDSALHREWIVTIGRLSALQRTAHLLCELGERLAIVGLGAVDRFSIPLTQRDLGDALGLSAVHANRVVQGLRSRGLLVWQGNQVTLPNLDALRELAEFDERYLHLVKERR